MRIPEIRKRLLAIAANLGNVEIASLANELVRRPPVRRSKVSSQPMTPAIKRAIRHYARRHPNASQTEIARHFNVNPGRVSEAINGYRE